MNEPTEMVECVVCGFVPKHQRRKLREGIETIPLDPESICDECLSVWWRRLSALAPRDRWNGEGSVRPPKPFMRKPPEAFRKLFGSRTSNGQTAGWC